MAPRETETNAYAKFWGDKQRALWYVMVFSGVVNKSSAFTLIHDKEATHWNTSAACQADKDRPHAPAR